MLIRGFLSGSDSEESACSAGDLGWTQSLGPEDPLEEGMATLQCSCLENPMGRGAWQVIVDKVAKSQT